MRLGGEVDEGIRPDHPIHIASQDPPLPCPTCEARICTGRAECLTRAHGEEQQIKFERWIDLDTKDGVCGTYC